MNVMKEKMEKMRASVGGSREVEMKLISTHDFEFRSSISMTVVKETGQIVVSGRRKDSSPVILLFTPQGIDLKEEVMKPLCEHDITKYVLSICTQAGEQLGVLCPNCKGIKLLDLRTQKVMLAFDHRVQALWQGDQHRLYAYDHFETLELDCSEIPFRILGQYKIKPERFCFAPSPFEMLISGDKNQIKAISCETNQIIWSINNSKDFDGEKLDPERLVFSTRHNALLVCDGIN